MSQKILKVIWVIIILLFISLQIYNLLKSNYADVVTSLLIVVILLAMIVAYFFIGRGLKAKKEDKQEIKKDELV